MILIDKEKVNYVVKEPLRMEWRTIRKPVTVNISNKEQNIKETVEEWDWFDLTCYTVAEIRNKGPIEIYKFSEEEKAEIRKK